MTGLIEILLHDRQFTSSNMREDPCLAKLDRILISDNWEARFDLSRVYSCPRPTSDYTPICLDLDEMSTKHNKLFLFEKWWLKNEEVHEMFRSNWSFLIRERDATEIRYCKWRRLRRILTRWDKRYHGLVKIRKKELMQWITELEKWEEITILTSKETDPCVDIERKLRNYTKWRR